MGKVLKILFFTGAACVVALFFLSITGIIENSMGNSFGFSYKTGYAGILLTLALIYVILTNGWLTWAGELGLTALTGFVIFLEAKTVSVLLIILTFILMWRHYRRNGGIPYQDKAKFGWIRYIFKVIYLPVMAADIIAGKLDLIRFKKKILGMMRFSFVIFCGINYALVLSYRLLKGFWNLIPGLSTFKDRLVFSLLAFDEYPLSLFGTFVALQGTYGEKYSSVYFVIDSTYVRVLLENGIIPLAAAIAVLTAVQFINYRKGFNIALLALALLSVDLVMDYAVLNLVLLLVFLPAYFIYADKQTVKSCDRLSFERFSKVKRYVMGAAAVSLVLFFAVWCVTAYKITNWRGHTPEYDATLVVPRRILGEDEDILVPVLEYLTGHEDASCIVDNESDRDFLKESGISDERIRVSRSSTIDEVLTEAHELIGSGNLPPRLTVCAYTIAQERISRHAARLHIPLNSISVRPGSDYYLIFGEEQWRLLCGE